MEKLSAMWLAWDWTDYLFELIMFPIAFVVFLIGVIRAIKHKKFYDRKNKYRKEEYPLWSAICDEFRLLFVAYVVAMMPLVDRFVEHHHNSNYYGGGTIHCLVFAVLFTVVWVCSLIIFVGIGYGIMELLDGEIGKGLICLLLSILFIVILTLVLLSHNEIWDFMKDIVEWYKF